MKSKQEIWEILSKQGCKSLYFTGSTANPHIKTPRDIEYVAVFDTWDETKSADNIPNVHKITDEYKYPRFFVWGYLFHYLNASTDYLGEKYTFQEPTVEHLKELAQRVIAHNKHNSKLKYWYHVAMIKAIDKYGYDEIPEQIEQAINDLHDFKTTFAEVEELLQ